MIRSASSNSFQRNLCDIRQLRQRWRQTSGIVVNFFGILYKFRKSWQLFSKFVVNVDASADRCGKAFICMQWWYITILWHGRWVCVQEGGGVQRQVPAVAALPLPASQSCPHCRPLHCPRCKQFRYYWSVSMVIVQLLVRWWYSYWYSGDTVISTVVVRLLIRCTFESNSLPS